MLKKKLKKFHTRCPYIEPMFLFLMGILIGFFINLLTNHIGLNSLKANWTVFNSGYFWGAFILIIIVIIYYRYFGAYFINKSIIKTYRAEKELTDTLVFEVKKKITEEMELDTKLECFEKTITTLHKIDAL